MRFCRANDSLPGRQWQTWGLLSVWYTVERDVSRTHVQRHELKLWTLPQDGVASASAVVEQIEKWAHMRVWVVAQTAGMLKHLDSW